MLVAIAPCCELLSAVRAFEWLKLEVHPQMVEHVAVLKRLLVAFGASVDFELLTIDGVNFSFEMILKLMILGIADHLTSKCVNN